MRIHVSQLGVRALLLLALLACWIVFQVGAAINCQPCKLLEARKTHAIETQNDFNETTTMATTNKAESIESANTDSLTN